MIGRPARDMLQSEFTRFGTEEYQLVLAEAARNFPSSLEGVKAVFGLIRLILCGCENGEPPNLQQTKATSIGSQSSNVLNRLLRPPCINVGRSLK